MCRAVLAVALLVLSAGILPGVVATTGPGEPRPAADRVPHAADDAADRPLASGAVGFRQQETTPPSGTTFQVVLQSDGDARWIVTTSYDLDDDIERAAFRNYGEEYAVGEAPGGVAIETFRTAATGAATVAGRPMAVEDISRGYAIPDNDTGTLTLSFVWTNFLATDGDALRLRDALRTPTPDEAVDTWMGSLAANQRLVIETPDGYSVESAPGFPYENDSLVIDGPYGFDAVESLVVRYEQIGDDTTTATTTPVPPENDPPWAAIVLVLVAALAVTGLFAARRGTISFDPDGAAAPATDDGDDPPGPSPEGDDAEEQSEPPPEEPPEPAPDPALLSDEEQVERLLRRNGGRMRQADIVDETGWSDAKVSQLLSEMTDDGAVEKLRLGRENLIRLPEADDPLGVGSDDSGE